MTTTMAQSACGRKTMKIDIFDEQFIPYGFTCCGECETIIQSRQAWEFLAA